MEELYLDHAATTPCAPEVVTAMMPFFAEYYANPHSSSHVSGALAAQSVEDARARVAGLIKADPKEIVFTSGATEANNLAIKGAARFSARHGGNRRRVITLATEHKCVLESVRDLAAEGFEPVILPVDANGCVDPERLKAALAEPTLLVSIMAANNETGVLQDIEALSALVRGAGALMHSDLAQAAGKIPFDSAWIDLGSISAHKIYGPKGVGALYVRHRPRARLEPLFSGGGQERTLRSGTLAPPLIAGFGVAADLARQRLAQDDAHLRALRQVFLETLALEGADFKLAAQDVPSLPGLFNLRLQGAPAVELLSCVPELALSVGSACSSADIAPSYVLTAMGMTHDAAQESLRLSPGRYTTAADMVRAARLLARAARNVRGSASGHATDTAGDA
ncbi:MAG: cysteine desulfurase [Acetobacter sp.]|jgi:cysteine desulfurase|nr:cysteine desulfurase [Acetobacter sp.]MCH4062239.1 cysteine desulfurase [Acetobacter sp.]MCH4088914.1 cysteine desulfurase [Acetobacter sp.]MCI1292817.1 cysteine desulfurase [Acetobacter sp.]MCI1319082.1 cysteine desulfurase [Acetobacter sp.]